MNADVSARLAWPSDAMAMAQVQVAAWREDYKNILPTAALQSLKAATFAESWETALTTPQDARMRVLVALERATVRGFALVHPSHDPDADLVADCEVGEFVIDPLHRRAGHGSRLLQAAMDTVQADKFVRALWWLTASDDITRAFVTESGWEADGAHRELESESGSTLKQIRLHTSLLHE